MRLKVQVAIVGAGPVGLTVAMDLAQRGIRVVVAEQRARNEPADPKCNTVSATTMEIFRGLGVADSVRAAGLADDFPTDAIWATAVNGQEIARIEMPSRDQRFAAGHRSAPGYLDSDWLTPEPVVRVSQYFLNPILHAHAESFASLEILSETEFLAY